MRHASTNKNAEQNAAVLRTAASKMLTIHFQHLVIENVVRVSFNTVQPQAVQRADARAPVVPIRVATYASVNDWEVFRCGGDLDTLKCFACIMSMHITLQSFISCVATVHQAEGSVL